MFGWISYREIEMIKFRCSHCSQKLGVPDEYAGRRVKCNKCGQPATVPHPVVLEEVPPKPKPAPEPDGMDILSDLDGLADPQDDVRQEAIRMAGNQRTAKNAKAAVSGARSKKEKKSKAPGSSPSQRTPIADMIPDIVRLPIALAATLVAVAVSIAIWIAAARSAGDPLCFVALFVPVIGALVLRTLTINHTVMLALLFTLIGTAGIFGGKLAIAKYVVIPIVEKNADEEFLVDLDKLMADENLKLPGTMSAKPFAQDPDFAFCVALISLVDDGQADPVQARKLAMARLTASNKANLFVYLTEGPGSNKLPEIDEEDQELFGEAYKRLGQWELDETSVRFAKKYFPALNRLAQQCEIKRIFQDTEKAFKYALLMSIGLLDLVWIMLGTGLGFVILVFD